MDYKQGYEWLHGILCAAGYDANKENPKEFAERIRVLKEKNARLEHNYAVVHADCEKFERMYYTAESLKLERMVEIDQLKKSRDHYRDIAEPYAKEIGKLLRENERLHAQMYSSQPYYYDYWKRLMQKIEAALELHRPFHNGHERFCSECSDAAWPCPTVKALRGEK